MISKKMADSINAQINREMYSGFLYMAMASKATEAGYTGAATWFMTQYHEEMFHAMKFYFYLEDQGVAPVLQALAKPEVPGTTLDAWFQQTLEHEKTVTKNIHDLMEIAEAEKDYATRELLGFYVSEQVEEEKNATEILQNLKLLGGNAQAYFMVNVELGKRALTVPTDYSRGLPPTAP